MHLIGLGSSKKNINKKIVIKSSNPYKKHNKIKKIGDGGYATVFLYKKGLKDFIAIKLFNRQDEDSKTEFEYEIKGFQGLGVHKHVVRFLNAFVDEFNYAVCLEYCAEGPLSNIFGFFNKFTEREVRDVVMQCAAGLQYLLQRKVVHRDIKPDNILVRKWFPIEVCICDLNFSKKVPAPNLTTILRTKLGTQGYMAPEIEDMALRNEKGRYNFKIDVYALGVVAYELLSNKFKPNFSLPVEVEAELKEKVKRMSKKKSAEARVAARKAYFTEVASKGVALEPEEMWVKISDEAKSVVSAMVSPLAQARPSYEKVLGSKWEQKTFVKPKPILGISM